MCVLYYNCLQHFIDVAAQVEAASGEGICTVCVFAGLTV